MSPPRRRDKKSRSQNNYISKLIVTNKMTNFKVNIIEAIGGNLCQ
jgi:hypothetical protein